MARQPRSEMTYPVWVRCSAALAPVLSYSFASVAICFGASIPWPIYLTSAGFASYALSVLAGRKDRGDRWMSALSGCFNRLRGKRVT